MSERTCSIVENGKRCDKPVRSACAEWCGMHYMRNRRHGSPLANPPRRKPIEPRFWRYVNKTDGCWLWTGGTAGLGYGVFHPRHDQPMVYAHRFAYELLAGPIPAGYEIDHLCRVRACCRPDHLEAVTPEENRRRQYEVHRKDRCPKGHPIDGVYGSGRRYCLTCNREKTRAIRERQGAALRYRGDQAGVLGHLPVPTRRTVKQ